MCAGVSYMMWLHDVGFVLHDRAVHRLVGVGTFHEEWEWVDGLPFDCESDDVSRVGLLGKEYAVLEEFDWCLFPEVELAVGSEFPGLFCYVQ